MEINANSSTTYSIDKSGQKPLFEISFQLTFDRFRLNIYNPMSIEPGHLVLEDLKNLVVSHVFEDDHSAVIWFGENVQLSIDLSPDAYTGPEAMCLFGPDHYWYVWN